MFSNLWTEYSISLLNCVLLKTSPVRIFLYFQKQSIIDCLLIPDTVSELEWETRAMNEFKMTFSDDLYPRLSHLLTYPNQRNLPFFTLYYISICLHCQRNHCEINEGVSCNLIGWTMLNGTGSQNLSRPNVWKTIRATTWWDGHHMN